MGAENFSMNHIQRFFSDFGEHYPFRHKEISWIRTPLAANLLYSFMKTLMRKDRSYKFQTGCSVNGYMDRLDGIFHVPNAQMSEQYMQRRLEEFLKTRYYMQQTYRLP